MNTEYERFNSLYLESSVYGFKTSAIYIDCRLMTVEKKFELVRR